MLTILLLPLRDLVGSYLQYDEAELLQPLLQFNLPPKPLIRSIIADKIPENGDVAYIETDLGLKTGELFAACLTKIASLHPLRKIYLKCQLCNNYNMLLYNEDRFACKVYTVKVSFPGQPITYKSQKIDSEYFCSCISRYWDNHKHCRVRIKMEEDNILKRDLASIINTQMKWNLDKNGEIVRPLLK